MVEVRIRVEAVRTTDIWCRYHGFALDQELRADFWRTQAHKIIGVCSAPVRYERTFDLTPGRHFCIYGNSGYVPRYAWRARIYINDKPVGEGLVGRNQFLRVDFTVPRVVFLPSALPILAPVSVGLLAIAPAVVKG